MKHDPVVSGTRKSVNLTLDTGIVAAAREAGLNLSKVAESAIREATRAEQGRRWKEEHREHFAAWNEWYEANGDPLGHLRLW